MGNEWSFMFRCIFLPGDLLWITASDTTHRHWEWLCAVNKSKIWQCFYFRFLKIYLVGSYLASGRPRLHQIALAEDRTNQAKCLHFPCLQVAAANLKCHNVLSHGQVNTERLQWGMQKWGRKREEGSWELGEKDWTLVTIALSSPLVLLKVFVPMLLKLIWGQDAIWV